MQLTQQVCTIEQAKRLKELGVEQDKAAFYHYPVWKLANSDAEYKVMFKTTPADPDGNTIQEMVAEGFFQNTFAAFTVAELGVMLPQDWQWSWPTDEEEWRCAHCVAEHDGCLAEDTLAAPTEAQARAAMLIYLLEAGLIKSEECNNRLIA